MANSIFIFIENKNEKPREVSLELLNLGNELSKISKSEVCAISLSKDNISKEKADILFKNGADKIYEITNEKLEDFNVLYYSNAIIQLIKAKKPSVMLFGATKKGRELAPKISSALKAGLTADCTKIEFIEKDNEFQLASTRPTFGGSLMATILSKTKPQMATVRENVIKVSNVTEKNGVIESFTPDLSSHVSVVKILNFTKDLKKNTDDIGGARIVLGGGMGLKNKGGFEKLRKLAALLGSDVALAASRAAVEAGFISKSNQIGQTGKTIAPKIYIAFGISGAIQHLCGVENADYIIAVNNDKNAQIFENCDLGIVQDATETIDSLIDELCKNHI